MGSEYAVPGKGNATQVAANDYGESGRELAPGKMTRVQQQYGNGGAAPAPSSATSKLGELARVQLIGLVSAAVGRAHTAYLSALGSLELERKIEKADELPLWTSILFAAGGKFLEAAFSLSVKALREAGAIEHELAAAGVRTAKHATEGLAHELTDKAWEAGISISIDLGKEAVKAPLAKAVGGNDQAVAGDYIDQLKDGSMFMFAQLAQKVYELDDAALVAAMKALAPENIRVSKFKTFLEEKINAFMKTRIRDVGKRTNDGKLGILEHKVGWMFEPGAYKPRLVYVDDVFDNTPGTPGAAYDAAPKLSYGQDATWTGDVGNTTPDKQHPEFQDHATSSGVRFVGPVEEEFVTEAIQQHTATWQTPPRNYRQITSDGAPRLEAL